jgi:hypothetical protein
LLHKKRQRFQIIGGGFCLMSRQFERERAIHTYAERRPGLTRAVLTQYATRGAKRLIIVLTPGFECRAGGVISIAFIYRESIALRHIHGARVALCALPGDPPFLKYGWFENDNYILDLEQVLKNCTDLDHLMLHIPAYSINRVLSFLASQSSTLLRNIKEVHLNVMLQNIDLVDGMDVGGLHQFGKVTCTTAHESYTNAVIREKMGMPLHRLSVCIGPETYSLASYHKKEQLLIISHDPHSLKDRVLGQLAQAHPNLTIKVIENLSYSDYRDLARRAKWSLTFGEGLDAYFLEPLFSGGVPFAVFNDRFFTTPFANLETVYSSWEALMENMPADIERLDELSAYQSCWRKAFDLASSLYSVEGFRKNLQLFYRGEYTFQ